MSQTPNQWVFQSARALALWTIALMSLGVVCDVVATGSDFAGMYLYAEWNSWETTEPTPAEWVLLLLAFLFGVGGLFVLIATVVLFCMWQYRIAANARALGAQDMSITPGWNVGWWFVPFANLVMPCKAMVENYKASLPDVGPRDWQDRATPAIVGWWWAMWLIGNVLAQVSVRLAWSGGRDAAEASAWLGMISSGFSIAAFVLIVTVIRRITRWQDERAAAWAASGDTPAGPATCPRCGVDVRHAFTGRCPRCGVSLLPVT